MNQQTVESMVTHLVQCSCNGFIDCSKGNEKGLVPFKVRPFNEEIQGKTSMKWNSILQDLLSRCPQFGRDELVLPRPADTARWREMNNNRKVLAPLSLEKNTENIIAGSLGMSRKRKADCTNIWIPPKRLKVDDTMKPCSVVIKRASLRVLLLQYKCFNNRPFVKLYDIIKEIPQVKEEEKPVTQNEFMGFLGLDSKEPSNKLPITELKISHPVKLVSNPQIPFSSDYGRRLLIRERHALPQDVALRKIERTEWYLKGAPSAVRRPQLPDITYDNNRSTNYVHTYTFPKKQYHQNHQSLKDAFNKYLCKPVCIHVEIMDFTPFLARNKDVEQEEIASNAVVVNGFKDEDNLVSETVVLDAKKEETLNHRAISIEDSSFHVKLRPQNKVLSYNEKVKKGIVDSNVVSGEKVCKPRRSLRLNHTKPSLK